MKLWNRFLDLLERWIVWPLLIGRFRKPKTQREEQEWLNL